MSIKLHKPMTLDRINVYPDHIHKDNVILYKYVMCPHSKCKNYKDHIVVYAKNYVHAGERLDDIGVNSLNYYAMDEMKQYLEMI